VPPIIEEAIKYINAQMGFNIGQEAEICHGRYLKEIILLKWIKNQSYIRLKSKRG